MQPSLERRAVRAAVSTGIALGLPVDDATVVQSSNRIAVHLTPCDTLARVAPVGHGAAAAFELGVARALAERGGPLALLDRRVPAAVQVRDGFAITLWTYHAPVPPAAVAPAEYALALRRMHAAMAGVQIAAPHVTDRVATAAALVANRARTPALAEAERELLARTLARFGRAVGRPGVREQLLHGEPHPGNLLRTRDGLLFVDLETACRGPVEFDVAHAPEAVGDAYPALDRALLETCRLLVLAMVTTWRWDREDALPDGRRLRVEWLRRLEEAVER